MKKTVPLLVVSPHIDDAVFSCGGRLALAAGQGTPALVVNVFTDFTPDPAHPLPPARAFTYLGEGRLAEEENARKVIPFETAALGFKDAALRHKRYRAPWNLFAGTVDTALAQAIADKLDALLAGIAPARILFPLGVGLHVDHLAVHAAAFRLKTPADIAFYEDLPYAYLPGHRALRLGRLSWRGVGRLTKDFHRTRLMDAPRGRWWGRAAWLGPWLFHASLRWRKSLGLPGWSASPTDISAVLPLKAEACFAYGSQIAHFFRSRREWEVANRRYFRAVRPRPSRAFEMLWRPPPAPSGILPGA